MAGLGALKNQDVEIKEDKDSVGGSFLVESGAYMSTIKLAYMAKSKGGALALNVHLETEDGDTLRQQMWVTSGDAKGNKTFYVTKDGEKRFLPGYNVANALCLLVLGKEIGDLETETKVVNLYDFDAKKELPTKVEALVDLKGGKIIAGIIKEIVDKNIKNDAGVYVPGGETREQNELDKMFRADDGLTVQEIKGEVTEAAFLEKWREKHTGVTKDKSTKGITSGVTAGAPAKPAKKLFA
jgi:hypothetical protein